MKQYWQSKLTAFDAAMFVWIEALTQRPCEPKNGGSHYFFEVDYSEHIDPDYIAAVWDALEGRIGKRLISIKDEPERHSLMVRVRFYDEYPKEAAFIPKVVQE